MSTTINVLGQSKKNITIFYLKIVNLTVVKSQYMCVNPYNAKNSNT